MYDDGIYAHGRLVGTIIRHNNKPIYVQAVQGNRADMVVQYSELISARGLGAEQNPRGGPDDFIRGEGILLPRDAKVEVVPYGDCDVTPVPLGFCSSKKGLTYLQRMPKRQDWRQGLRPGNFCSTWGADSRWVNSVNLYKTICGIYPNMELAIDEAANHNQIVPFCREFAVGMEGRKFRIFYKWFGAVGSVVNNQAKLEVRYQHLQEFLEERIAQ